MSRIAVRELNICLLVFAFNSMLAMSWKSSAPHTCSMSSGFEVHFHIDGPRVIQKLCWTLKYSRNAAHVHGWNNNLQCSNTIASIKLEKPEPHLSLLCQDFLNRHNKI